MAYSSPSLKKMTEIIHVDQGEVLLKFSQSMPTSDLIELIENRLKVPISLIVLYNKEGKLVDINSKSPNSESNELYLFRRDSVVDHCTVMMSDWLDFKDFPEVDIYELPFQFEIFEKFPQGFERVPRIEKCLFELYKESKQLYSKFMVKNEYIEKCKTFIEIRIKSSEVLMKNLRTYYKDIKYNWKKVYSSATELHIQYNQVHKIFNKDFESFNKNQSNEEICSFVREANIGAFAIQLMKKFNKYITKIHEVKSIVLSKIKQQIASGFREIDKVQKFYQYSNNFYSEFDLKKKSEGFNKLLKVASLYSQCRSHISLIVDKFCRDKRNSLNEILALERQMNMYKELSIQQCRVLNDIDSIENAIKECIRRVDELYKEKIILITSVAAQKLKYRVRAKLVKFEEKIEKFRDFQEFVKIPSIIKDAENAYRNIKQKHDIKTQAIRDIYEKIAFEITEDNTAKKVFLKGLGKMIPSKFYPGIKTPMLESSLIRRILSLETEAKNIEIERTQCEKHEIIEYYQNEIKAFDDYIKTDIEKYKNREKNLLNNINKTVRSIQEIEENLNKNDKTIKNVKQELEIVKVIGQENLKNKLMEELQKLKEKEEAFKMIFMERHKELSDANSRLRYSITRKEI